MPITKIISGGQTGADRGGLDAAIHCHISHGGWCPKGRKSEDGIIPVEYRLTEMKSADYLVRTKANVIDSDATVIFTFGSPSGGSLRTIEFCRIREKPYHTIDLKITNRKRAVDEIVRWLKGDPELNDYEDYEALPPQSCTLNVAGSRESKALGIQDLVYRLLVDVFIQMNPECRSYYPPIEKRTDNHGVS